MAERTPAGFTLVELIIVISVICILAMLAVPSYLDQVARGQVKSALPLAEIAQKRVAEAWAARQAMPADNAAAGLPPAEKIVNQLVSAVTIEQGAVHLTFGNRASKVLRGKRLTLRPAVVVDAPIVPVTWVCAAVPPPPPMTVRGTDRTNLETKYLPLDCRVLDAP